MPLFKYISCSYCWSDWIRLCVRKGRIRYGARRCSFEGYIFGVLDNCQEICPQSNQVEVSELESFGSQSKGVVALHLELQIGISSFAKCLHSSHFRSLKRSGNAKTLKHEPINAQNLGNQNPSLESNEMNLYQGVNQTKGKRKESAMLKLIMTNLPQKMRPLLSAAFDSQNNTLKI